MLWLLLTLIFLLLIAYIVQADRAAVARREAESRQPAKIEQTESTLYVFCRGVLVLLSTVAAVIVYCLVALVALYLAGSLLSSVFNSGYDPESDSFNESLGGANR